MRQVFDGKKNTKLGGEKRPAVVRVQTAEREAEVSEIFEKHGWKYSVTVDPDEDEDVAELDMLLNPVVQVKGAEKVGRNAPCPCGSGKKFKKCCIDA